MSDDEDRIDWDLVERTFLQARHLPPEEREAFVKEKARGDPAITRETWRLLGNDVEDDFLEPPGEETLLDHLTGFTAPPEDLGGHLLFGQYELGALIGRGGAGAVYEGVDRFTGRSVAVKVLTRKRTGSPIRFELASLRMLRLPGVVSLIDDGEDERLGACLVMSKVEGRRFGPASGPRPWGEVRRITGALLEALVRIHTRGMIHKDLKPANVLVDEDGFPTILDLGISGAPNRSPTAKALLVGTPGYMAPEVTRGELPDERADLHAVGLMAYEVLTGTRLFDAGHAPTTLHQKQEMTRATVDAWLAHERVPDDARACLAALLAPSPAERPTSARAALALFLPKATGLRHPALAAGTEAGVAEVFVGHERVFHIPSDAAAELWRRTTGDPDDVQSELEAWERARLGRFEPDGFHIDRAAIEELRAGFHPRVPSTAPPTPPEARALVPFVRMLPAPARIEVLAGAAQMEHADVEAQVAMLEQSGIVDRTEDGEVAVAPACLAIPQPEHAADYAGRLANAWAPGRPGRLELLVRAGRDAEVPAESIHAAHHAFRYDSLPACVRVCELGLRTGPPAGTERALLAVLLRASLPQSSRAAIERALILIERSGLSEPEREPLERIARAALHGIAGRVRRAWDALPTVHAADADELVQVLDGIVRNYLLRQLPPDEQERRVRALHGSPEEAASAAAVSAWAWLRLLQCRYADAARLFERQLELAPHEGARANILSNLLYVHLLLFRFDAAEANAEQLLRLPMSRRMPPIAARLEHYLRTIEYMQGREPLLDPALVAAIRSIGNGGLTELALLQEAAIAWRQGADDVAIACLAEACADTFGNHPEADADPLARAFFAYLAPKRSPDTGEVLAGLLDATETPDDMVQVIALMAMRDPAWVAGLESRFEEALRALPRDSWGYRRQVLSIDECVAAMKS